MNQKKIIGLSVIGLLGTWLLSESVFTLDQRKQAIVLQFGRLERVLKEPGLKFKTPFIEQVNFYEKRILEHDSLPIIVITGDQKRLIVDTFTRYVIDEPSVFFQRIKPATEEQARSRINSIVNSAARNVIGAVPLRSILTQDRTKIMNQIEAIVQESVKSFGLRIIGLRISRTELPPENRKPVFERMNAELKRFAKENRARGEEKALGIRSRAERERTVLLAQAEEKAHQIKGEGESQAIQIASESVGRNPKFYQFLRQMDIYENLGEDITLILSSQNELFNEFLNSGKP